MINQQSEENNVITLSGVVVTEPVLDHILYGEEFYTFCISIPRLSGASDVLPLTVSDRLMAGRMPVRLWLVLRAKKKSMALIYRPNCKTITMSPMAITMAPIMG